MPRCGEAGGSGSFALQIHQKKTQPQKRIE